MLEIGVGGVKWLQKEKSKYGGDIYRIGILADPGIAH